MSEKKAPAKSSAAKGTQASAPGTDPKPVAKSTSTEPKAGTPAAKAAASATPIATRGTCTAEKCERPLRAKGYCRKHFFAWRRRKIGGHHRYKICTREACRKPRLFGSLCAEHAGKGDAAAPGAAAGATS
jgi:hypothetical protein